MRAKITAVGLGPGDIGLLTPQTRSAIAAASRVFLRTRRHPAAAFVSGRSQPVFSFDEVYERADRFDDVYEEIVNTLISETEAGALVYAVPGSPLVLERTVELLREAADAGRVELEILPAMSFLDAVWAALQIDPVEEGVRLVDGHLFATAAAGESGPLLVAHCHARHVLSDIKLAVDEPPSSVIVLQRLGLPDEHIAEVAWTDLDRLVDADHLTSIYIPHLAEPVAHEFARFDELVRTLRGQCQWDREQTHSSLRRHLLEESYETLEALDARGSLDDAEADPDLDEHLAEELGDLLYQIFFHARIGAERGAFTVADVARGMHDKLVLRHPHVFGDVDAGDTETVLRNWELIKAKEKGRVSAMEGIPLGLPALMLALKTQKRAASAGFDFAEGSPEVRNDPSEAELGDWLFAVVEVARRLDHDPEAALRGAVQRFAARVVRVEELAASAVRAGESPRRDADE